jgi:alkylhydroperoxidase family enzyme
MAKRLKQPRVSPRPESDWDDGAREVLEPLRSFGPLLNIFGTLAHHPALLKRWMVFGNHVLAKSTLPAREREILILRIGWLCQAEYEWGQHAAIGRQCGLSDEEIRRIAEGPEAPGWSSFDATLLRAADELHGDAFLSDATWKELSARYSTEQMIDVVFTVGQYNLVSMALNSLGVQREAGVEGFPEKAGR